MRKVSTLKFLALFGSVVISPSANAAPDAAITTSDCVLEEPDSNSPPSVKVCGFRRIELNSAGDRLLTMTVAGTAQLWDRSGKELLKIATKPYSGTLGGAMIANGQLYVADLNGQLISYNMGDGKEVARKKLPTGIEGFMQIYGTHFVLAVDRENIAMKYGAIDLNSGDWARRWDDLRPNWFGKGQIIGTSNVQVAPKKWETQLVFADDALTEIPAPPWCRMDLEEKACISEDFDSNSATIMDVRTRTMRKIALPSELDGPKQIDWLGSPQNPWVNICKIRSAPNRIGAPRSHCRLIDANTSRVIHAYNTVSYKIALGKTQDGKPELRLAYSEDMVNPTYEALRIGLNGNLGPAGPKSEVVALNSLFGDLLVGLPGEGDKAAIIASNGAIGARVPARYGYCQPDNGCSASSDKSVVAVTEPGPLAANADSALDRVRWFDTGRRVTE